MKSRFDMPEKIKLDLKDAVADTLLITLYAKSIESQKKDPLITDTAACDLIEKIDYDFSKYKNKTASSVGVALRASHFDNMTRQFIQNHAEPVVVLVGCGLDTRVQRLGNIASKAVFYELDIDEVIKVRAQMLPPADNEHYIAASMLTTEWMDQLLVKHPTANFIFIIEGVLMYFNEADNRWVFTELAKRFPGAELHFDMLNKWMSRQSKRHDTVGKTNATFKFGINSEKEIEAWHPGLKHQRTYLFNEFKGWQRMGLVLTMFMNIIPVFKTAARAMTFSIRND